MADKENCLIRRIALDTGVVSTVAGNGVEGEVDGLGLNAQFSWPFGLAMLNGTIWVTDYGGARVRKIGMVRCVCLSQNTSKIRCLQSVNKS